MSNVIELNFKQFVEHSTSLPGLPQITRTSVVRFVERNKNPVFVLLADGTKLYFTWDEFKRISGPEPTPGKKMTVYLQRLESDNSQQTSKIDRVVCHD